MIVFWILILLLVSVLILVLSHFFGVQVFDTTNKIYAEFDPTREEPNEIKKNDVEKKGKENV